MNAPYLPQKFHNIHNICIELVGLIEEFLTGEEYKSMRITSFQLDKGNLPDLNENFDAWEYLKDNNREGFIKLLNKNILLGLLSDFCYFMQESLGASSKMRLVVAYALLRRPLVDNLKILLNLLYNDSFYDKFISDDNFDSAQIEDKVLQEYLEGTDEIRLIKPIDGSSIYHFIFDKHNPISVINLSNRAIHPVTTRPWNKTGVTNFNFMFVTMGDNYQLWDHYYAYLSPILLFYVELFNSTIFGLFNDEIDGEPMKSRIERMAEIMSHGCDITNKNE